MKLWQFALLFIFWVPAYWQCKTVQVTEQSEPIDTDLTEYHDYYLEVMRSYCVESDTFFPSEEYMDSLLRIENTSIFKGGLFWAPDSAFKIMVVEGEGCGAYCNPFWESRLITATGLQVNTLNFTQIDTIHQVSHDAYLVIQSHFGRPAGFFTVTGKSAIMLRLNKDSVNQIPIPYNHPKWGSNMDESYETGRFSFDQEHFLDYPLDLSYDGKYRTIRFKYATDFEYCCGIDSAWSYEGEFKFKSDTFRLWTHIRSLYDRP